MPSRALRPALIALDTFVAVSAVGGGVAVAAGVDRFPRQWLVGSPFADYVWPGLILTFVVGGSAAVAAISAWRQTRAWAPAAIVAGLILAGWIAGETVLINQNGTASSPRGPFEVIYLVAGMALMLLGALAWRSERKPSAG